MNTPSSLELEFLSDCPSGMEGLVAAGLLKDSPDKPLVVLARNDARLKSLYQLFNFAALGKYTCLQFPAWDCLPYDRVGPRADILGRRLKTLLQLNARRQSAHMQSSQNLPLVVFTTLNAFMQRLPSRACLKAASFTIRKGLSLDEQAFYDFLNHNGYLRASVARDPGDYAVRGGLIDIFPAGAKNPVRLDLFGDEVERIRRFDAATQITAQDVQQVVLMPISEVLLTQESIGRFRRGYREYFGAVAKDDPLYEAVSAGRRFTGMEHWLPLFYESLESLLDYLPDAQLVLDHQAQEAKNARLETIRDFYDARRTMFESGAEGGNTYKPLKPEALYLDEQEWQALGDKHKLWQLTPFAAPESSVLVSRSLGGRVGRDFAPERKHKDTELYESLRLHIRDLHSASKRVIICASTQGARERLSNLLADHEMLRRHSIASLEEALALPKKMIALAVLTLEHGFETPDFAFITEQDILGEKIIYSKGRRKRADNFLAEISSIESEDLVVHIDHGVGQYKGLETIELGGAPHDVLALHYAGDDRLYIPVENIEVLSRFGGEEAGTQLDRLGGAAWQARKAKVKKRLKEIARDLMRIAAARQLQEAAILEKPEESFSEFCARFPFVETEDQLGAIEDTLEDLTKSRPMDRLICGDVGFGKTEVAIRAAFVAAMNGMQVALICPTTLLARQHYNSFQQRFDGWPVRIAQLSRLVPGAEQKRIKEELGEGTLDIVIGTHTLLASSMRFKQLGLLVIDEEQKFGVKQKERLKALKETVHVLTLSATPIPRTLQLSMAGVKDLSLITTPPVDRLAVRTFVTPWDAIVLREALLREQFRGGQAFVVCPRIRDLSEIEERLKVLVPEVKICIATGQLPASELESVMSDFYDRKFDLLLATNIIESGIDIPSVNTLIIHRADMFGLSSLYQLRGRVGRSKERGYAYLTYPVGRVLGQAAQRRLEVLQTLDNLGAGFQLASHDLDIRGAGNLVGEEQSGHVREVGIELYQQMLEEAVAQSGARGAKGKAKARVDEDWTPQINLGTAVLIPENYVMDLNLRMGLYRRLSGLESKRDIESFAAELIDRFGKLPQEAENLLEVMQIKRLCRAARVSKVDVGPKGVVVQFHKDRFPKPGVLLDWAAQNQKFVQVRPDQKLVYKRNLGTEAERSKAVRNLLVNLVKLAA